jgi:dGTP triphosphohydrolase
MVSLSGTKLNQMDEPTQGTHVPQVAEICHRTRPFKKVDLHAQEWGPKFITALWDHSLRIWHFRNDAFHRYTNTQVKRYQLEELERKKTQLWKRYTELQTILHRFQQKHFESPDTVNNLRYDSQKCLTALAKLFLDEAESRLPSTDNELLPRYLTTRAGIG